MQKSAMDASPTQGSSIDSAPGSDACVALIFSPSSFMSLFCSLYWWNGSVANLVVQLHRLDHHHAHTVLVDLGADADGRYGRLRCR